MGSFGPLVTAEWLAEHLDDVHLFDSRKYLDGRSGYDEFLAGHIPGAVFVDLDTDLSAPAALPPEPGGRHPFPTPEHFASAMSRLGYDGTRPAVIYDDVSGGMAGRMRFMLRLIDIPAAILDGGIACWTGSLATGPVEPTATRFAPRPWPAGRLVDADDVARRIDSGAVVIDARSAARYRGEANPIDDRFGHIPGAINRAWQDNLDPETARMLSAEQLAERYRDITPETGAREQRPVVYCGSGVTACHNMLALELLGVEADLYVGSWSEWGGNPNRPLATGADHDSDR